MIYETLYDTVLARIPPETAHALAVHSLNCATLRGRFRHPAAPELAVDAFGLRFPSPLGVAAGLDKNAEWFGALGAIGFGFVEVGTVTPRGQDGNPPPRIARVLADRALVNRMGFPNDGAAAVVARLTGRATTFPLGINLGKNLTTPVQSAADDYASVARSLGDLADYVVINVSSPNTPGLRALEAVADLEPLIAAVQAQLPAGKPLLVKISPDMPDEQVDAVAALALRVGLAGVIATNTTVDRGVLSETGRAAVASFEGGGVSGPPLRERSLAVLRRLHRAGVTVISVGGVSSAEDVWERVLAGASLVQAYTGFIYGGPGWPASVNRALVQRVRDAGAGTIQELVGSGG